MTTPHVSRFLGLVRSLLIYRRPGRQAALQRLYADFVREGDLVFDIGAHLGDRTSAFAALGARVVAVEPQPHVARWLRRLVARQSSVTVRSEAVGASEGVARLAVSRRTPTVSTMSESWRSSVSREHEGFGGVRWEDSVEVPVITLDSLIESHGCPAFCKIDVEGYEAEVLAGLSEPVEALSFEFVASQLDVATRCVRRLEELAEYRFNVLLGEGRDFVFEDWIEPGDMLKWLDSGAQGASSGDVYARCERRRAP